MTKIDLPETMRAVIAAPGAKSLSVVESALPVLGPTDILIRVQAASLNYRDLAILRGAYGGGILQAFTPGSDASGIVVAAGADVTRFAVGDWAMPVYIQGWIDGRPTEEQRTRKTLGTPLAGVLQDYVAVPETEAVRPPSHLSHAEAATLPVAALTAWTTLQRGGIKPSDWILIEGTGGVALFALQFAKLCGARVAIVSSRDEKITRAKALGADVAVNYRSTPEWGAAIRDAVGGQGVDIVLETSGSGMTQAIKAVKFGGYVGIIGFVGGTVVEGFSIADVIRNLVRLEGVTTGPRSAFEAMNLAIETSRMTPVIDSTYTVSDINAALERLANSEHFGKIVIDMS